MNGLANLVPVLALVLSAQLHSGGPASGKPIERGRFQDSFSLMHQDYCGVPGLRVTDIGSVRGSFLVNTRGRAALPYVIEHFRERTVVTNVANGRFVVWEDVTTAKDLKVTDNHDGTFTVLAMSTGNTVVYGPDGKAIGRNPGQTRVKFLIDNGGTPKDLSDDSFLKLLGVVKGSTGRTDDLCAAMLAVLV